MWKLVLFLAVLQNISVLVDAAVLAVIDPIANRTRICEQALQLARQDGFCPSDVIEVIYRLACDEKLPAVGTVNAAELHFKGKVDGFIAPWCIDEYWEISRLAVLWKKPLMGRAFPNAKLIHTAVTIVGPWPRTVDMYPLSTAVFEVFKRTGMMEVKRTVTVDDNDTSGSEVIAQIENGTKLVLITLDFPSLSKNLLKLDLRSLVSKGFVMIFASPEPLDSPIFSAEVRSSLASSTGAVIVPIMQNFDNISMKLATYDDGTIFSTFADRFSMFSSCYGYCYLSQLAGGAGKQDFASYLKGKQIQTSIGDWRFDGGGQLMMDYSMISIAEEEAGNVWLMNFTAVARSDCTDFICFDFTVKSEDENPFFDDKIASEVPICVLERNCSNNIGLILGIAGGVLLLGVLAFGNFIRRKQHMELYRMHWKIRKENLKIIENKQASIKGGQKIGDTLSSRRRLIGAYALVGTAKAEFLSFKQTKKVEFTDADMRYLFELKQLNNDNITKFMGLCVNETDNLYILHVLIERASLEDFIKDSDFNMDITFKSAFLRDIIKGLTFLHRSPAQYHGMLLSSTCLIDANWVLKLSDYGISTMVHNLVTNGIVSPTEAVPLNVYQFFAPELLSMQEVGKCYPRGTKQGDMYSFGMIIYQLTFRSDPFESQMLGPKANLEVPDLIEAITVKSLKPEVANPENDKLLEVMITCWNRSPETRPTADKCKDVIHKAFQTSKGQLVDQMMKMNEKYAQNLERIVEERNRMLQDAQQQTMRLLNEMLPQSVAETLKTGGTVTPRSYDLATVLFAQVCDFQVIVSKSGPEEVIQFLNDVYDRFDTVIKRHDAYKVETTGETYMVASGVPMENDGQHILEIAEISLEIRDVSYSYKVAHLPDFQVRIKIGFHCGPIAAGVIGIRSPRYCLFGDTVNFSSRMQSNCPPNQIQTSEVTAKMLMAKTDEYKLVKRGIVQVKGKGEVNCYWLNEHIHDENHPPNKLAEPRLKTMERTTA